MLPFRGLFLFSGGALFASVISVLAMDPMPIAYIFKKTGVVIDEPAAPAPREARCQDIGALSANLIADLTEWRHLILAAERRGDFQIDRGISERIMARFTAFSAQLTALQSLSPVYVKGVMRDAGAAGDAVVIMSHNFQSLRGGAMQAQAQFNFASKLKALVDVCSRLSDGWTSPARNAPP
jgi:hypothetical protein